MKKNPQSTLTNVFTENQEKKLFLYYIFPEQTSVLMRIIERIFTTFDITLY